MKTKMRCSHCANILVMVVLTLSCSSPNEPDFLALSNNNLQNEGPNGVRVFTTTGIGSNVGAAAGFGISGDENTRGWFDLAWRQDNDKVLGSAGANASGPPIPTDNNDPVRGITSRSLDMGEVSVQFGAESIRLVKSQSNDIISYRTQSGIPFRPGMIYNFVTTGSDDLGAATVSLTAPDELVRIVGLEDNSVIDPGDPVSIKWEGRHSQLKPTIAVYPLLWRDVPFGQNQILFRTLLPPEKIELEKDSNEFTLSAQTLDRFASTPSDVVAGIVVFVLQNVVARVDVDGGNLVAGMRNQDARVLYYSRSR